MTTLNTVLDITVRAWLPIGLVISILLMWWDKSIRQAIEPSQPHPSPWSMFIFTIVCMLLWPLVVILVVLTSPYKEK